MMKSLYFRILAIGLSLACLGMAACTQMPTEKAGVTDMRPAISFRAEAEGGLSGRVIVDGMDVGAVADYQAGQSALRILPGNHRIQVVSGGSVLLDEKVYIGDGVNRSFLIK